MIQTLRTFFFLQKIKRNDFLATVIELAAVNQVRASKAHFQDQRATFALFRRNSPNRKSAKAARFPRKCAFLARLLP